ncbi:MAG: hypothetical protein IKE70_06270 [Bacilli bacterium]|nr:hypothetical protein [Bacilli bacterium]
MAKTINIVNGVGSDTLINDTYNITANVTGYENSSILPTSIDVVEGTNAYSFTISATGTLTLHVTEDGTTSGTPIVGATFIRTDSTGTEYGTVITTDQTGNAVFNNIPYDSENAPSVYFKQLTSDGNHNFDATVQTTTLTTNTETLEITNTPGALRTIQLTDANYENLPVESGNITLTN